MIWDEPMADLFFRNEGNGQFADEAIGFDQIAKSAHDESDDLAVSRQIFESLPLRWTGAWNLTREKEVLVPINWFLVTDWPAVTFMVFR